MGLDLLVGAAFLLVLDIFVRRARDLLDRYSDVVFALIFKIVCHERTE